MQKRTVLRRAVLRWGGVVLGLGLWGCDAPTGPVVQTDPSPATSAVSAPSVPTVGLVMKTLTNPFFIDMEKGARRAERDLGVKLVVKTAAQETSIEQQIQLVQDLVVQRVQAIVIAPGDSKRLVDALKQAQDAGIKLVNIDNRIDPESAQRVGLLAPPFISVDNAQGAYQVVQTLVASVRTPTEAVLLEGIRSADNAQQRAQGARRAFAANPAVKLVASESANWKIDEAHTLMQNLLRAHPRLGLVFAANDMMAIGASKALQEAGRTDVRVVGFDALPEALELVRSGVLMATVDQQAAEQGYQGVALAKRLLRGESVPAQTLIDTRVLTRASLN